MKCPLNDKTLTPPQVILSFNKLLPSFHRATTTLVRRTRASSLEVISPLML